LHLFLRKVLISRDTDEKSPEGGFEMILFFIDPVECLEKMLSRIFLYFRIDVFPDQRDQLDV